MTAPSLKRERERKPMRLKEIGQKIDAYLKRFEADSSINRVRSSGLTPFFHAVAFQNGSRLSLRYVSFQGWSHLTRQEAEQYLAWLEQGGIGTHYKAGVR